LILSYFFLPSTQFIWDWITSLKKEYGLFFIATVPIICGGLIPLIFHYLQNKISKQFIFHHVIFCIVFWGYRGTEINYLYDFFAYIFGDSTTVSVIVKKVLCDQFIYSLFWSGPTAAVVFKWKANDFNFKSTKKELNKYFFTVEMGATIFSLWLVWIPAVTLIYILPLELQYTMFNIVLCFYSFILSSIQKNT
jgi:hypothetical protein